MKHTTALLSIAVLTLSGCSDVDALFSDNQTAQTPAATANVDATMLKMASEAEAQLNYPVAIQTYEKLLETNKNHPDILYRYGEALRKSGDPERAHKVYLELLRQNPSNLDALEGKGLSELAAAQIDTATNTLTQVMQRDGTRWKSLNAIGILFATKRLYNESLQYFSAALQQRPNHPSILNNKGIVQAMDRQFAAAIQTLSMASAQATSPRQQMQTDLNAALVYAITKDQAHAAMLAEKHLQGAALQNNLGLYALLAKDANLARTHLNMALSESKTFYEKAWNNLESLGQHQFPAQITGEQTPVMGNILP